MPKGIYTRNEKHCKIISLSKKGSVPWNKGKKGLQKAWNKGKKCPWTTKRNIETNHLFTGENAHHWKGGLVTRERKLLMGRKIYQQWRSDVLERDSWTCQTCGARGTQLHAHHIRPWAKYKELRYCVDNGVTLCRHCHELLHSKNK